MSNSRAAQEVDFYDVLNLSRTATPTEIKKAYHKICLACHPDKVPEAERGPAEERFKSAAQAYEILSNESLREQYDNGTLNSDYASFGGGDYQDMFSQLFTQMGMNGPHGMSFASAMGGAAEKKQEYPPTATAGIKSPSKMKPRGENQEQPLEVTMQDLYKGKTRRFKAVKAVACSHCKAYGIRQRAKRIKCIECDGQGQIKSVQMLGQGLAVDTSAPCLACAGAGDRYREKDLCSKCQGHRTVPGPPKLLEIYIPPGSVAGQRIVLNGEADYDPDAREQGDLLFKLQMALEDDGEDVEDDDELEVKKAQVVEDEEEDDDEADKKDDTSTTANPPLAEPKPSRFTRRGNDLATDISVSLAEALTGFKRVVCTHLDGRGISIHIPKAKQVLRPGLVLKINGEGMPIKGSPHIHGDLYLLVDVIFPEDGFLNDDANDADHDVYDDNDNEDEHDDNDHENPTADANDSKVKTKIKTLRTLLPKRKKSMQPVPELVDECSVEISDLNNFGGEDEWQDEDEDGVGGYGNYDDDENDAAPQCATQ